MKKALLFVVAVVVLAIVAWFAVRGYATAHEKRAAEMPWPASLGPVDDAVKRFPDTEQSGAATTLVQLAAAAHLDLMPRARNADIRATADPKMMQVRKEINEYVKLQLERSGDAIDAPPPGAVAYLTANDAALNAVRDHLLSGTPIVWKTRLREGFTAPIPNLVGHMNLQKILAARALEKAHRNDAAAWDELRASWQLNRGLWNRPDLVSILVAVASSRLSNATARKMPLPAPAWLQETLTFDYMTPMAASQQAEAWTVHHLKSGNVALKDILRETWYRWQIAEYVNVMRNYTTEALKSNACDAEGPRFAAARASLSESTQLMAIPNLVSGWHRLMRFRAELEATERVLQLRAGQKLTVNSRCSEGTWQLTANGMRFSHDIRVPERSIRIPLDYVR